MSEAETTGQAPDVQTDATQAAATTPTTPTETAEAKAARLEKEVTDLRRENAGHRTKLKSQEDTRLEQERKAAEESGQFKTLYEQQQAETKRLADELSARDRAALQAKVASEAGLPASFAGRLQGDDEAALLADAKAIAKELKLAAPAAPSTGATNPGASRGSQVAAFDPKNPPRLGMSGLFKD